jgi:hypothetical protein
MDAASRLEALVGSGTPDGIEWRLDGVLVGVLGPGAAEFRLRREVAAAALRTPDVTASPRGAGWVRFAPATLEGYAGDRARAWLESAWRYADEVAAGEG